MTVKIAFLFLTLENPNYSDLWDKYLTNLTNVYIHPKYPEKVSWRRDCIIKDLQPTGWGFITKAYLSLLREAYKNKENYKFITISESCVPIKPFDEFYDFCKNDNNSYIKIMKISKYDYNERLLKHINKVKEENKQMFIPQNFIKHYARFCLNREHVKKLIELDDLGKLDFFHSMHVGDEFFLSSLLPLNHYIDFNVIFDDWEYVNKEVENINNMLKSLYELQEKYNIDLSSDLNELKELKKDIAKNPKTITIIDESDLKNIKNTNAFFYRKFSKESNIRDYYEKIMKKLI